MSAQRGKLSTVSTRRLSLDEAARMLDWRRLPPSGACAWANDTDVVVGWGQAASFAATGPHRIRDVARWWADFSEGFATDRKAGPGPMAIGSLGYAARDLAVLTVPAITLRIHDDVAHLVCFETSDCEAVSDQPVHRTAVRAVTQGSPDPSDHIRNVNAALEAIRRGVVRKVVLSRDVQMRFASTPDERHILRRLRADYPTCTTFAHQGLIGASPERLLRVQERAVSSTVLGGTAWPDTSSEEDWDLHRYDPARSEFDVSVAGTINALRELVPDVVADDATVLQLRNVSHYSTTLRGNFPAATTTARSSTAALELLGALHPTPAVSGDPVEPSEALLSTMEARPRGGYASPVGWIDTHGDCDWWLALRAGQIAGETLTITAGGGVVRGSDPDREVTETTAKMAPLLQAVAEGPTASLYSPEKARWESTDRN